MCESTTSSSSVECANSVDSQASAVSLHVLTTSSQLSPLVTASSVSALSPTGKPSSFSAVPCFLKGSMSYAGLAWRCIRVFSDI